MWHNTTPTYIHSFDLHCYTISKQIREEHQWNVKRVVLQLFNEWKID